MINNRAFLATGARHIESSCGRGGIATLKLMLLARGGDVGLDGVA
jgi:hypothetical protein